MNRKNGHTFVKLISKLEMEMIASEFDVVTIFKALDEIGKFTEISNCAILRIVCGQDGNNLECMYDWSSDDNSRLKNLCVKYPERLEDWRVELAKGHTQIVPVSAIEDFYFNQVAKNAGLKTMMLTPIVIDKKYWGSLAFFSKDASGSFENFDEDFTKLAALTIVSAIIQNDRITALRKAQLHLKLAIEGSGEGVWEYNMRRDEMTVSYDFSKIFAITPKLAPRRLGDFQRIITDKDYKRLRSEILKHLKGLTPAYNLEFKFRDFGDGRIRWGQVNGKLIFDNKNRAERMIGTFLNVTERKLYEEKLKDAINKADTANKAKSEFLATMSHEIRTPLNAITGFLSLLQDYVSDETAREYIDVIQSSSSTLTGIINDILDFSKIESSKLDLDTRPFSPSKEFLTLAKLYNATSTDKGINFSYFIDPKLPDKVVGDILRINQVLSNLLNNALKFTPAGGDVFFGVKATEIKDGICIMNLSVKDTGMGISETGQANIFNAFVQADSSVTRRFGGTGLGLAISKKLLGLMGSEISLYSLEGKGSNFFFSLSLPIEKIEEEQEELINTYTDKPTFKGKVLVAEDNAINAKLVLIILGKYGIETDLAVNGKEAVDKVSQNHYDLILMDVQMPVMDGIKATEQIRKAEIHTPIVALTANVMNSDMHIFKAAGMNSVLTKPIDKDKLEIELKKYIKFFETGEKL